MTWALGGLDHALPPKYAKISYSLIARVSQANTTIVSWNAILRVFQLRSARSTDVSISNRL